MDTSWTTRKSKSLTFAWSVHLIYTVLKPKQYQFLLFDDDDAYK